MTGPVEGLYQALRDVWPSLPPADQVSDYWIEGHPVSPLTIELRMKTADGKRPYLGDLREFQLVEQDWGVEQ